MSHFTLLVQTKKGQSLDNLMEPFSENLEVEPYEKECWCMNRELKNEARNKAEKEFGTFDSLRDILWNSNEIKELTNNKKLSYYDLTEEKKNKFDEISKVILKEEEKDNFIKEYMKSDPNKIEGPNKECEDCNGTGRVMSTYNPNSKWDWFAIGGRWAEMFDDGESIKTGKQIKELGEKARTFAILTHDGRWIEKGTMGWWACVSDKKKNFNEIFLEEIAKFEDDDVCYLVDCHI